jgi:hypothetical protein
MEVIDILIAIAASLHHRAEKLVSGILIFMHAPPSLVLAFLIKVTG